MTLFVGTSGWGYKEWRPLFYPEGLPQARFLQHYARALSACEVNATFYRLQSRDTFDRWAALTPESFRFAIKAHRRLTHGKSIAPDAEQRGFLHAFLESLSPLGPRLGPILFQLPPYRERDDGALAALLGSLPPAFRYAFEFRHASWSEPAVAAAIESRGGSVCLSESAGRAPERLPGGTFAYARLRADRYGDEARDRLRALLIAEAKSRDVFVFAKHEGIAAGDRYGGVGLAQWLAATASAPSGPRGY